MEKPFLSDLEFKLKYSPGTGTAFYQAQIIIGSFWLLGS